MIYFVNKFTDTDLRLLHFNEKGLQNILYCPTTWIDFDYFSKASDDR